MFRRYAAFVVTLFLAGCTVFLAGCAGEQPVATTPASSGADQSRPAAASTAAAKPATTKLIENNAPVTNKPIASEPRLLASEELNDGWISLFDGESLFGWTAHSKANWRVEEDAIVVDADEPGLLCTNFPLCDYTLHVEFQADAETNSGIFLRTPSVASKDDVTTKFYELNIAPASNPYPTGSYVGRAKCEEACQDDGWRSFDVTVQGQESTVRYNDRDVLKYVDPAVETRGFIGLQFNSGRAAFRNIKLKPLGLQPLLGGESLAGWQPSGDSKYTVENDQSLHVQGGKGYLELKQSYGDFVLQVECKTNAKNLNSGIFFRCIPGEAMNGYESQIHNGYKNNDRTQPMDCGTGGIFRRVNARRVMADDQTWFSKTIIATGPHVAVWVNGYQVTDWTDTRQADDNPRNGLRTATGTLQLQGHDPTTDLSFRNMRASEIMP